MLLCAVLQVLDFALLALVAKIILLRLDSESSQLKCKLLPPYALTRMHVKHFKM